MTEKTEKATLKVRCPNCQQRLDVSLLAPFTEFPCPECGFEVTVPQWWHDYLLESRISSNDGIELYRALDMSLDREVMIEMVTDAGGYSEEEKKRYLEVIRLLSSLVDPSLCVIYGCGTFSKGVYSVLQYMPTVMTECESHTWSETQEILKPLLACLSKVANEEIYHGRICPQFMRRAESGTVCLTGFGVGMSLHLPPRHDGYESPESLSGAAPSLAGDIYSLGKLTWFYLTGKLPEEGGVLGEDVPADIASLLREMTALAPYDRPKSYDEILHRVLNASVEGSVNGKRTMKLNSRLHGGRQKVLSLSGVVKHQQSSGPVSVPAPPRGGSLGSTLVLLVLLGVVGVLVYMLWSRGAFEGLLGSPAPTEQVETEEGEFSEPKVPGDPSSSDDFSSADDNSDSTVTPSGEGKSDFNSRAEINRGFESNLKADMKPLPADLRKRRPRLASPLMGGSKTIKQFVKSLPTEYRGSVESQIRLIGLSATLLRDYTSRIKFDRGAKSRLILYRTGRVLKATVVMANNKGLRLRPISRSGERLPKRVHIEDLHWITYIEMLDYYGKFSLERFKTLPKGTPEYRNAQRALVHHYLILTLLCDWYDQGPETLKNARKCFEIMPQSKDVLANFGIHM